MEGIVLWNDGKDSDGIHDGLINSREILGWMALGAWFFFDERQSVLLGARGTCVEQMTHSTSRVWLLLKRFAVYDTYLDVSKVGMSTVPTFQGVAGLRLF